MSKRRSYVFRNTNPKRDAFYNWDGKQTRVPWLEGDYIKVPKNSAYPHGATDDLVDALKVHEYDMAVRIAQSFNKEYGVNGTKFTDYYRMPYPDSCGEEGYAEFAPIWEVVAVDIDIKLAKVGKKK